MPKKTLFRSDSSNIIGLGHIMRDLVYATRLKDADIYFASQELSGNINYLIPYPVYILSSSDVNELISLCKKLNIEHLIVDNYDLTEEDEKKIKETCTLFLSVFDDTYKQHHCDEVINHNIGSEAKKYDGLIPDSAKVSLIKPLIRDEFKTIKLRNRDTNPNEKPNIFICMGGVDSLNLTPSIIKVCQKFHNIQLHIITTSLNKNLPQLKKMTNNINNIELHINTDKMAQIMNQCDLAIITPSVIVHEVMFMQLPFITIKSASNQKDIYSYLKEKGFNTLEEFDEKELYNLLQKELS